MQDSLKQALKNGSFAVPEPFAAQLDRITHVLKKLAGRLEIKNADERRQVRTRQAVLHGPEFKALWDRIKHKTTYRVQFDNENLIEDCVRAVRDAPSIPKTRLQWRKADIAIGKAGVEARERDASTHPRGTRASSSCASITKTSRPSSPRSPACCRCHRWSR